MNESSETTIETRSATGTEPKASTDLVRKVTIAASIGTFIEAFDLVAYGTLAAVLSQVFFPGSDGTASLLATFATFALAFVARPLGGLFWGPIGDRIGRKRTLVINIVIMTGATALIGIIPSHATIGLWAPGLLILLRFFQGISAAGEIPGAAIFVGEYSPKHRRARQTSALNSVIAAAELTALLVATLLLSTLSASEMLSWGWRIPFLVAAPIGAVGLYIRYRLEETPVFEQVQENGLKTPHPLKAVVGTRRGWKLIGRATLFNLPVLVPGYLLLTFMPSYLTGSAGLSKGTSVLLSSIAAIVMIIMVVMGGRLSDRIGRRQLLLAVAIAEFATAYPAFALIQAGGYVLPAIGLVLMAAPFGLARGGQLAAVVETFPTEIRFTGFALSLGLAVALIGGPTPFIATWLVSVTGSYFAPAWFLMAVVTPSMIGAFFLREPRGRCGVSLEP
ncbi:MFS transporter [Arthrobacter sp. FW305-BF8]|uniref:MFS transporter n=1 Tax=Arthrobacter sp. FW305-BF8 TaxID=2879617 RepID=UPI001F02EEF4|nr:MFS transporter [Arthrobacter sp. FW305-BF8]UKA55202.1 MFS transporter [Arthrobacter sp. FW305-BF8]